MSVITLEKDAKHLNLFEQELEQAALYALGALEQPEARAFEDALATEAALAAEVRAYDEVVAGLALSVPEVPAPAGMREKLLDRIGTLEQAQQAKAAQPVKPDLATISLRLNEGKWRTLAPKVSCKVLYADSQTGLVTSLIKLAPGGFLPRHRHLGIEQMLVVAGECHINGEVFSPGDFRMRPTGTEDTELTTEHGATILLVAPKKFEILDSSWLS
jgi:anti-sigma factor ChrR (cupin superfamily)